MIEKLQQAQKKKNANVININNVLIFIYITYGLLQFISKNSFPERDLYIRGYITIY